MSVKVRKRGGQQGMSNLFQKLQLLFDENLPEKNWLKKSLQANQLKSVPSTSAHTLAF